MAARIDTGWGVLAHTAIQAVFGRAQITANRDNKCVGVVCDLAGDELSIVDLSDGCPDTGRFLQIFEPAGRLRTVMPGERGRPPVDLPGGTDEAPYG